MSLKDKSLSIYRNKKADDMDETSGKGPTRKQVEEFLRNNPDPMDDAVHDWSEENGFNNHKTERVLYEIATERVS